MNTLEKKIAIVTEELEEINKKLNHYKIYDSEEKINEKIESILENKGLEETINYTVEREVITQKKKVGRGRVTPNSKYTEVEKTLYNLKYSINEEKKLEYKNLCGYFILATNKPANELTMKEGLMAYKEEWRVENIFSRLKGPLQVVVPIYLQCKRQKIRHLPHQIKKCDNTPILNIRR